MATQPKWMTITGWIITALVAGMLTMSAGSKVFRWDGFEKEFADRLGYPISTATPIGAVELACAVLYLIPQTAVLGAVLLTGYLGGATATHVRVDDPFIGPVIGGVLMWLGIYLRDPRLRKLMPWRTKAP